MHRVVAIILAAAFCLSLAGAALLAQGSEEEQRIKLLRTKLQSGDEKEVTQAIVLLRKMATDEALDALVEALKYRLSDDNKLILIDAVASYNNKKAVDALVGNYNGSNDFCRRRIIDAVKYFTIPEADELIVTGLGDFISENQIVAVQAAQKRSSQRILDATLKAMLSSEAPTRKEIAKTLPAQMNETQLKILEAGLRDREYEVVNEALKKLGTLKGKSNEEKVALAKQATGCPDPRAALALAQALGDMPCPDALDALARMLQRTDDPAEIEVIFHSLEKFTGPQVLPVIQPFIRHKNLVVRTAALKAVAAIDDPRAENILVDSLRDDNAAIRLAALGGLKKFKDPKLIVTLISIGKAYPDPEAREKVVEAILEMPLDVINDSLPICLGWTTGATRDKVLDMIGRSGNKNAAAAIITVLRSTVDPSGRFMDHALAIHAANALRLIGGDDAVSGLMYICTGNVIDAKIIAMRGLVEDQGQRSLDTVVSMLADKNSPVRLDAVKLLGSLPGSKYVEQFTKLLDDEDTLVRSAVISALGRSGDPKVVAELLKPERVERARLTAEEHGALIDALGLLGGEKAVEHLLQTASGGNERLALVALRALGTDKIRGNKDVADALQKIIDSTTVVSVRCGAIKALGSVGGADVVEKLAALAPRSKFAEATAAVEGIAASGEAQASEKLVTLLNDASFRGSQETLLGLIVRLGKADPQPLVDFVAASRPPYRKVYIGLLARVKDPKVKKFLLDEMAKASGDEAAEALGGLVKWHEDEETRKAVIEILRNQEKLPSIQIIRACAGARGKEYVEALIDVMRRLESSPQKQNIKDALYSLRCITNNDAGESANSWLEWWGKVSDKSLDEIVLAGFSAAGYRVSAANTADSLYICVNALSEKPDRHYLRANALRRLKAAAGGEPDFLDEKQWDVRFADEWYFWWIANKAKLTAAGGKG